MTDTAAPNTIGMNTKLNSTDRIALGAAILVPGFLGSVPALGNLLVLPLIEAFEVSRAMVIFLIELAMVGNFLLSPVVGRILLRIPPWIVLLTGVIIGGFALLAGSFANSFAGVMTAYIIAGSLGMALGGVVPSQTFVVQRSPDRLGRISGGQTVMAALVGVAISICIPPILVRDGWQAAMMACGVIVLVVLPPLVIGLMRERRPNFSDNTTGPSDAVIVPADHLPVAPTTLQILKMPSFWLLVIGIVPLAITALAVSINVIPFLAERGVATQEAGYVLAGIGASAAIGALSIGTIVDRTHPAWVIAGVAILATISLTAVATGIGNPAIYFIAMYAGLAGVAPTMAVGIKRLFGVVAYAPIAGLIAPFLLLSAFSGAGTGWLRDHLGSYQPVFGMMAVLCAVSLLAALLLTRRQLAEL